MRKGKVEPSEKSELRRRAEDRLKQKGEKRLADDQDRRTQDEMRRLIHELQVHQIELEMQNDELSAAQARIEESRSRYEDLFDFSPLGYFTFDGMGIIQALNLTGAQLLGKERGSLIQSPFSRFIDEKSLNVFLSHLEAVFGNESKQSCELWLKTKERSHVPVVMESVRIEEGRGEIGQCRSVVVDITKRKRAEEALRESEVRLNLALAASGMGVWEWNIATGAVFWSPECFTIMGVKEFDGKLADFIDALHPEESTRIRTAIDGALAGKTVFKEEFRIIRPDGEVRWLSNLGRAAYDECGKPLRMTGTVQDVTVRKLHEEVMQRYELLAGHSRDIILFLNRDDGRILEANAAAVKAYGYTREEILALTIHDLRAAGTLDLTAGQMARAEGQGLLFETIHRRKDGRTCPMEVSSRGAIIGDRRALVSVIRDITKRRKAENALREREELFRVTFDRSPIGAALVGIDQRITRANNELCRMLGYAEEEIVGMTLRDVTHPDDIEADLENVRMMLAGRRDSFTMEKRYIRKEGGIVWGRLSAGLVRDAEGSPSYFVGMIEDITGRVQAERHHNLAAEILRILNNPSTLDGSVGLILDAITQETGFDAAGIRLRNAGDLPYIVQNSFSRDFLPVGDTLPAQDGCGDPCRDGAGDINLACPGGLVMSGRTDPAHPCFTTGGSFWTNDARPLPDPPAEGDPGFHPRDTCIHQEYLSMALIPIRANGEIAGLLQLNDRRKDRFTLEIIRLFEGIAESIGIALVRKRTERLLEEQSTQLENANKELESFSYSVSHDLRAPLRAIEGFSRVILKRKGDQFDEETKRQFKLITDNAQRMNQLIDDILAFSRSGKQERVVSRIDMEELVRERWEALCAIHPGGPFEFRMDRLPAAMGDRALIAQVLTNLLSNAVKYSAGRDMPIVEVGGRTDEKETVYSIKDNGVGFDMAYYPKLFGVFQRLHGNSEFEGTGVGLAIVQRIIHRHGGRVWAEAEKDKGATFSFTLPTRQE